MSSSFPERERQRHIERKRETETETEKERQGERDRGTERDRKTERGREREETERQRKRETERVFQGSLHEIPLKAQVGKNSPPPNLHLFRARKECKNKV